MQDLFNLAAVAAAAPVALGKGMGGHQSANSKTDVWLTPPEIIESLGGWQSFALDPCAAPAPQPWRTARTMFTEAEGDGLAIEWEDSVFLNAPYSSLEDWLAKLAEHGQGVSLMFARTETEAFHRHVWQRAAGVLFLKGRLFFHHPDGTRAKHNGGAPSVLCAYGQEDMDRLAACDLEGAFVPLRFARFAIVEGLDQSWADLMRGFLARQRGTVSVSDAYRYFARHPKAKSNRNWQAKVRQKMRQCGHRVARDSYQAVAA